jgi:S-(hydroxymethyl)glutathione dehydrogenase/alcohol dehydrogenase
MRKETAGGSDAAAHPERDRAPVTESVVSRRRILRQGMAAAVGGGAGALLGSPVTPAEASGPRPQGATTAGQSFRAFVRYRDGVSVEQLRLLPIQPREVVIRSEASMACYSITPFALRTTNYARPTIMNHSGTGVVVEVGPMVRRVQPGDRVIVAGTPQCGQCYQCLQGRADHCQWLSGADVHPVAEMADGTGVVQMSAIGGISEMMVAGEEYCCPVFTDLPAAELAMLADTSGTGLAAGMNLIRIEPGSDVVVLGAGPLGLAAIQSARIMGAARIIAVEPIAYRREKAIEVGATAVLDPNAEGDGLVATIQDLCGPPTDRLFAGGSGSRGRGSDYTIEAVGGDQFPPAVEVGPDPTGILPLRQAWTMTRPGGHIVTHGIGQRGEVSFPASAFCISGKTFHAGQQGGLNMMRDLPRFVRLAEEGLFDGAALVGRTYALDQARDAFEAVAARRVVSAVVVF